jgi:hypothetical protein
LLLKRRSNSPHVRRRSLSALSALVSNLEQGYVVSIPFAVPFCLNPTECHALPSELLKDDVVDGCHRSYHIGSFPTFLENWILRIIWGKT